MARISDVGARPERRTDNRLSFTNSGRRWGVMLTRILLALLLTSGGFGLAACETSSHPLKISLVEDPTIAVDDSPRIVIDDARPHRERLPHRGKDISRCERWFGDEMFLPSKLIYLDQRVAERTPNSVKVHLRLTRFDVVEYCEHAAGGNSTSAAMNANKSLPGFTPQPVVGDTVVLRLAGDINGVPFDVSRQFDYGTLYRSPRKPASYPAYQALLRSRLEQIIDKIVESVWRDEALRNVGDEIAMLVPAVTGPT